MATAVTSVRPVISNKQATNAPEPTYAQLKARLAELEAKVERQDREVFSLGNKLTGFVGPKGGFCVRGLGKNPVSLYYSQWIRLLASAGKIGEAVTKLYDEKKLSTKEDETPSTPQIPN